jgi:putative endonuclease
VFVEVKARTTGRFGGPLAAVTSAKQRKLTLMALDYLARSRTSGVACRFDVVAVEMGAGRPRVEVVTNAFIASDRSR